jgi:peptidoglycan/LPS O-acetylase OafA/YrhL
MQTHSSFVLNRMAVEAQPAATPNVAPAPSELPAQLPKKPRNQAIDVVRLIAAIAIVYVHAVRAPSLDASRDLVRFAVPFYLFASFYFQSLSLRTKTDQTLWQYIVKRAKRLYLPFLAWSGIYMIARDIRRITLLHLGLVRLTPGLLWKGIEYQLWFLPFLLAGSILLAVIHWGLLRHDRRWRWPLIIIALAAGIAISIPRFPSMWDPNQEGAYIQNYRALPALCWAMAFAWFMTMGPKVYEISIPAGLAGIALTVVCSIQQAIHGVELIPRALTGLGTILAALAPWKSSWIPFLARLGRYSFGVYLCHVLVAETVRDVVSRTHLPDGAGRDLIIFFPTLAGSLAITLALGRSKRLAWLNG